MLVGPICDQHEVFITCLPVHAHLVRWDLIKFMLCLADPGAELLASATDCWFMLIPAGQSTSSATQQGKKKKKLIYCQLFGGSYFPQYCLLFLFLQPFPPPPSRLCTILAATKEFMYHSYKSPSYNEHFQLTLLSLKASRGWVYNLPSAFRIYEYTNNDVR